MSISDIVDYVNRTPHNTNPAVIRSMVENEVRQSGAECCEDLKQIKSEGGVGYTETWSITWDGNLDGRFTVKLPTEEANFVLVHVSDRVLSIDDIKGAIVTKRDSESGEETSHTIPIEDITETLVGVSAGSAEIVSIAQDSEMEGIFIKAGTYFLSFRIEGIGGYDICSITNTSVRLIDSKYLSRDMRAAEKAIKDGGTGYIEEVVKELMPATIIHASESEPGSYRHYRFIAPASQNTTTTYIYVNDSKYEVWHDTEGHSGISWVNGPITHLGFSDYNYWEGYEVELVWYEEYDGPSPEYITLRVEGVEYITHHMHPKFLPEENGRVAVRKAKYDFEDWDEGISATTLEPYQDIMDSLYIGCPVHVIIDGTDYQTSLKVSTFGEGYIGNIGLLMEEEPDTGEPFVLVYTYYEELRLILNQPGNMTHIIEVILPGNSIKTNLLDLGAFGIDKVITELVYQGGGTNTLSQGFIYECFWSAIDSVTGTDAHLLMNTEDYQIEIGGISFVYNKAADHCGQLSFVLILEPIGEDIIVEARVIITRLDMQGKQTKITVKAY